MTIHQKKLARFKKYIYLCNVIKTTKEIIIGTDT